MSRIPPSEPTSEPTGPATPQEPLAGPTQLISVVAAVARRDQEVLVALRSPGKRHGGLWEFPGGKVLEGETLHEAVRRELAEELGVGASRVEDPVFRARDPGSPFLILFIPVQLDGAPRPMEHSALSWRPPSELTGLPLAPSDARFVREYLLGQGDPSRDQNDSTRSSS